MLTLTRLLCIVALGLSLGLVVAAPPPTPKPHPPAVVAILQLSDNLDEPDASLRAQRIVQTHDSCEISRVFAHRRHGGAGIGNAALAGHNDSIDVLVTNWSGRRPPTREELQTHQQDLQRVARVLQTMAELAPFRTPDFAPSVKNLRAEEWRRVSLTFQSVTRDFRTAIASQQPGEVRKVAVQLRQTCDTCHVLAGL